MPVLLLAPDLTSRFCALLVVTEKTPKARAQGNSLPTICHFKITGQNLRVWLSSSTKVEPTVKGSCAGCSPVMKICWCPHTPESCYFNCRSLEHQLDLIKANWFKIHTELCDELKHPVDQYFPWVLWTWKILYSMIGGSNPVDRLKVVPWNCWMPVKAISQALPSHITTFVPRGQVQYITSVRVQ